MTNNQELALIAAKTMISKKAEDVVIIDIGEKSSFADYFVLASAGNQRLLGAICDEVEDKLAGEGLLAKNIEGKRSASGWVLMDFGDLIVNVLTQEMREKYNIEKVWGDCQRVEVGE